MNIQLSQEQKQILETEVEPIIARANALMIRTTDESLQAQEDLKEIKRRYKIIHEKFDPPVRAAHTAWKAAKDLYNFFTEPFVKAEEIVKRKVITFQDEVDRKRREEAARIEAKRQQEERERKAELERQAQAAEAKGKKEKAEALREKAEVYVAPPAFIAPEAPQAQGTAFKKTWKGEVTDLRALLGAIFNEKAPLNLILINQSALNAYAKAAKNSMPLPGVRFFEESNMAVTTGK